jgi:hypothetical protein
LQRSGIEGHRLVVGVREAPVEPYLLAVQLRTRRLPYAIQIDARPPLVAQLEFERNSRRGQPYDIRVARSLYRKLPARDRQRKARRVRAEERLIRGRPERAREEVLGRLSKQRGKRNTQSQNPD